MASMTYDLRVETIVDATRDDTFRAWTTSEDLKRWYRPGNDWTIPVAEVKLSVGGAYRFGFHSPEGKTYYEVGEFREIESPKRLVYTCRFEGAFEDLGEETLTVVEFDERGDKTRVRLATEGYLRAEERDAHRQGWPNFLDQLRQFLEKR